MTKRSLYFMMGTVCLTVSLTASSQAALISYWEFNGSFADSVGSNTAVKIPDGAQVNNATTGAVDGRTALILDGLGDGLMTPANLSLDFGVGTSFTYSFWVRGQENGLTGNNTFRTTFLLRDTGANPFNGNSIVSFGPSHNTAGNPNVNTNVFRGTVDAGTPSVLTQASAAGDVLDGTWHHVAWVVKDIGSASGSSTLYLDGAVLASDSDLSTLATGDTAAGSVPLYIGAERVTGSRWLLGAMDDLAVWGDALPLASIQGLANSTYTPLTAPIPEPSGFILAGIGLAGFALRRRWQ